MAPRSMRNRPPERGVVAQGALGLGVRRRLGLPPLAGRATVRAFAGGVDAGELGLEPSNEFVAAGRGAGRFVGVVADDEPPLLVAGQSDLLDAQVVTHDGGQRPVRRLRLARQEAGAEALT